jgi:hypothetical protein
MSSKFLSRKLLLTVFAVAIVAGSDLLGLNLDDESLSAIVTLVIGAVSAQGLIDVSEVIRSGRSVAGAVAEVSEAVSDE